MRQATGAAPEAADQELMRRIAQKDETALGAVYDRYSRLLYGVILRIVRDAGAADEILQDLFYHLWRNAARFDPARGSLGGWLLVSARNRAVSRLRRRQRENESDLSYGDVALPGSLEGALVRNQLMEKVRRAMSDLPSAQRQALELSYFEGLTHSEIAERTGEPLGTVKTRLRAAIESLKQVFPS